MAVPWHKYAARYKSLRIEDTATYTLFEKSDKVKVHTIVVLYSEIGKSSPSVNTITIMDGDSNVLQVMQASTVFSITSIPIPVMPDNGLKVAVSSDADVNIDLFITYTPSGS